MKDGHTDFIVSMTKFIIISMMTIIVKNLEDKVFGLSMKVLEILLVGKILKIMIFMLIIVIFNLREINYI